MNTKAPDRRSTSFVVQHLIERRAFYPPLVAAYPVLFLWSQNVDEVLVGDVVGPLLLTVGITLAGLAIGTVVSGDHRRAALAVSGLVLLFLSYGHVWGLLDVPHPVSLGVWTVLSVGVVTAATRVGDAISAITRMLNIVALALLVITVVPLAPRVLNSTGVDRTAPSVGATELTGESKPQDRRDIFYIIVDRYPRADNLEELFGDDNSEFIGYLEERGFTVAHESIANYPKTAHSLAASLNMRYLDHLANRNPKSGRAVDGGDWQPIYGMLRDHGVGRFLTNNGYRYIHLGTWWEPTSTADSADVTLRYSTSSEFSQVLTHTTPLPVLRSLLGLTEDTDQRLLVRNSSLYQLRELDRVAAEVSSVPRFVFAHVTLPHEPFVFDSDGSLVTKDMQVARRTADNFLGQLEYTNSRLRGIVDRLLDRPAEAQPLIVIQADEALHPLRYRRLKERFVWPEATDAELLQKFRILNAYFLPGAEGSVYPSITPVNTFRLIFDRYFDTGQDLLDDRAYVFHDHDRLYDFTDVTERIRSAGRIPDDFQP